MRLLLFNLTILCVSKLVFGWYTCIDFPFCQNIRYKEFGESPFQLDLNEVTENPTEINLKLIDTEDERIFSLAVSCIENSVFRFRIDDPNKRRYHPDDVLIDLNLSPIETEFADNQVKINCETISAIVYASPFRIEVTQYEKIIAIANGEGKLTINSDDEDEAISLDFHFLDTRTAYGLPLHSERLSLEETGPDGKIPYRLYNVDNCCESDDPQEPLYGSVPVLYAHGVQRSTGLFWLNSAQTYVDISTSESEVSAFFISESGVMDFFVLTGPTLQDATRQYTKLTGTANLPPYFSIGYHQSRYSYMSQADLLDVVENFDKFNFPVDVLWLDIDYTDSYKYFTWNYEAFPRPIEMQNELNSTGRKLVVIIDPHIKAEEGYFVYDTGIEKGYFVRNPDGSVFTGECWPGLSAYLDFFNPEARDWYSNLYDLSEFPEATENMFIWNDMNEPVVFDQDEETMPNPLVHHDGYTHRDLHNVYGFYQTLGTWNGLMSRSENRKRPFVLTRSHFAGTQRFSAIWTGDNVPTWEQLRISIPMCLTEALSGISNCGADVGGFVGNVETELLERWYQTGAWLPFFRQHSAIDTDRREPYLYSSEVQAVFRKALRDRYAHLDYWYTVWYEHERFGDPVIRPISFHYSNDPNTYDIDDQWLVGENILVHPVTEPGVSSVAVYFPGGSTAYWYDIENNLIYRGIGEIEVKTPIDYTPYFYRGGSIVLRKNTPRKSSEDMKNDMYNLYIFLDELGEAHGTVYKDDYESFDYREKKYIYYAISCVDGAISSVEVDTGTEFNGDVFVNNVLVYMPWTPGQGVNKFEIREEDIVVKKDLNLRLKSGEKIQIMDVL